MKNPPELHEKLRTSLNALSYFMASGLTHELIVVGMAADPKPLYALLNWNAECAITQADANTAKCAIFDGFELQ